jgi:flagellar biosynthetic protein FlhB
MSAAGDRTEKATPKRRDESRKEGQVAKSMEVSSAFAMLGGFTLIAVWGPHMVGAMATEMKQVLSGSGTTDLKPEDLQEMFIHTVKVIGYAVGPFFAAMAIVGVAANLVQVKFKITPEVLKPRLNRMNPINGFKQKFSINAVFELFKSLAKLAVVSIPAIWILWAAKDELLMLGDMHPVAAGTLAVKLSLEIGLKVGMIYVVIAIIDYLFQRYRHEKSIRMTKQEVKTEMRQQDVAPELKAAQRRRQREAARKRMLSEVPNADVIITNPTHYSIALKYDPELGAPQVLAKGVDLLALRIREIAEENNIMRVENRPLARQLYASVEVGQVIPPEMFAAVAEVLAFVYKTQERKHKSVA